LKILLGSYKKKRSGRKKVGIEEFRNYSYKKEGTFFLRFWKKRERKTRRRNLFTKPEEAALALSLVVCYFVLAICREHCSCILGNIKDAVASH
jgi:hypothetical protein